MVILEQEIIESRDDNGLSFFGFPCSALDRTGMRLVLLGFCRGGAGCSIV